VEPYATVATTQSDFAPVSPLRWRCDYLRIRNVELPYSAQRITDDPTLGISLHLCAQMLYLATATLVCIIVDAPRCYAARSFGQDFENPSSRVTFLLLGNLDFQQVTWSRTRYEHNQTFV
jgi:hypothetical protein